MIKKISAWLIFLVGLIAGPVAAFFLMQLMGKSGVFSFGIPLLVLAVIWASAIKISMRLNPSKKKEIRDDPYLFNKPDDHNNYGHPTNF
jgi:hypothetical protein